MVNGTCNSCKYWGTEEVGDDSPHRNCLNEKVGEDNNGKDDLGYSYSEGGKMSTGPDFGCIHHKIKGGQHGESQEAD